MFNFEGREGYINTSRNKNKLLYNEFRMKSWFGED